MIIEQASIDDLPVILAMRQEASDWLAKQRIDQWASAWADPEGPVRAHPHQHQGGGNLDGSRRRHHRRNRRARLVVRPQALDAEGIAAAGDVPAPLIVRHKYFGLGADIIEWACRGAGELSFGAYRSGRSPDRSPPTTDGRQCTDLALLYVKKPSSVGS